MNAPLEELFDVREIEFAMPGKARIRQALVPRLLGVMPPGFSGAH